MGGAVQKVGQAIGVDKKPQAPEMPMAEAAEDVVERASAMDEQQGARMRGARRRGRQLLSDARLNTAGSETLGGGNNL
jgi:hypothetical protein